MSAIPWLLVGLPLGVAGYAYLGYPLALRLALLFREAGGYPTSDPAEWPLVSVSLPAYNEEAVIGDTLEALLAADYPSDKLQVVVVSDASTDRTDEIVAAYEERGVELVRQPERGGKTAAERAAARRLRGDVVLNMDASIRILPGSLEALVRALADPEIGVASGRDVSVGEDDQVNIGESGYVGYEMAVRRLETCFASIVGASGCFYAIRKPLHLVPLPNNLSRDFASVLICREAGLRAVSVDEAVALVPRTGSLRQEYRRKVRTMSRGLLTLWHKRRLLDPREYGTFALMLASHKLARWLLPPSALVGVAGLVWLGIDSVIARLALGLGGVSVAATAAALWWPADREVPRPLGILAYALLANLAGVVAWFRIVRGERDPMWEPTRRGPRSAAAD